MSERLGSIKPGSKYAMGRTRPSAQPSLGSVDQSPNRPTEPSQPQDSTPLPGHQPPTPDPDDAHISDDLLPLPPRQPFSKRLAEQVRSWLPPRAPKSLTPEASQHDIQIDMSPQPDPTASPSIEDLAHRNWQRQAKRELLGFIIGAIGATTHVGHILSTEFIGGDASKMAFGFRAFLGSMQGGSVMGEVGQKLGLQKYAEHIAAQSKALLEDETTTIEQLEQQARTVAALMRAEKRFEHTGQICTLPAAEAAEKQGWGTNVKTFASNVGAALWGYDWRGAGQRIKEVGQTEISAEQIQIVKEKTGQILDNIGRLSWNVLKKNKLKTAGYVVAPILVGWFAPVVLPAYMAGTFAVRSVERFKRFTELNKKYEAAMEYAKSSKQVDITDTRLAGILAKITSANTDPQAFLTVLETEVKDSDLEQIATTVEKAGKTGFVLGALGSAAAYIIAEARAAHGAETQQQAAQPVTNASTGPAAEVAPVDAETPAPKDPATPTTDQTPEVSRSTAPPPSASSTSAPSPSTAAEPPVEATKTPDATTPSSTSSPVTPVSPTGDETPNPAAPAEPPAGIPTTDAGAAPAEAAPSALIPPHEIKAPITLPITATTKLGEITPDHTIALDIHGDHTQAQVYQVQTDAKGVKYIDMRYLDTDGDGKAEKLADGSYVRLYLDAKSSHGTILGEHIKADGSTLGKVYAVDKDAFMSANRPASAANSWLNSRQAEAVVSNTVAPGETKGWGFVPRTGVLAQIDNEPVPTIVQAQEVEGAVQAKHLGGTIKFGTGTEKSDDELGKLIPSTVTNQTEKAALLEKLKNSELRFDESNLKVSGFTLPDSTDPNYDTSLSSFVNALAEPAKYHLPSNIIDAFGTGGALPGWDKYPVFLKESIKDVLDAKPDVRSASSIEEFFKNLIEPLSKAQITPDWGKPTDVLVGYPGLTKTLEDTKKLAENMSQQVISSGDRSDIGALTKLKTLLNDPSANNKGVKINIFEGHQFIRLLKGEEVERIILPIVETPAATK